MAEEKTTTDAKEFNNDSTQSQYKFKSEYIAKLFDYAMNTMEGYNNTIDGWVKRIESGEMSIKDTLLLAIKVGWGSALCAMDWSLAEVKKKAANKEEETSNE